MQPSSDNREALPPALAAPRTLRPIHLLLTFQTALLILGSLNRLTGWTLDPVPGLPGTRWRELLNLLVLPLLGLLAAHLVMRFLATADERRLDADRDKERGLPVSSIQHPASPRRDLAAQLLFLAGAYFTGIGYGVHEIANYLHGMLGLPRELRHIVAFQDDGFSHWIFFGGFMLVNGAVLACQAVHPWAGVYRPRDRALLAANGLAIAAGIVANLAFQRLGLDLFVILAMALQTLILRLRAGPQPLFFYYATGFLPGLLVSLLCKLIHG